MTATLTVVTDGRRECIDVTVDAALEHLHGIEIERILICDDSGDAGYHRWLTQRFTDPRITFYGSDGRSGYARAAGRAWRASVEAGTDHVFWLEDDFILTEPVDLAAMARVLDEVPHLVQLMLKRQAWWANEVEAGGVCEFAPERFHDRSNDRGDHWVEYDAYWSNPHLTTRAFMAAHHWPDCAHSEAVFGGIVVAEGSRGAFWGRREDPPRVEHVGIRQGTGY